MVDSKKTKESILRLKSQGVKVLKNPPKGYRMNRRATTQPVGYVWYTNGKSLFGGERKTVLVREK